MEQIQQLQLEIERQLKGHQEQIQEFHGIVKALKWFQDKLKEQPKAEEPEIIQEA